MEFIKKAAGRLSAESRRKMIVFTGIAGLLLIFISGFIRTPPESAADSTEQPDDTSPVIDYRKTLEEELSSIVSAISGVGEVRIMITMDSTAEDIYAVDKNESESLTSDGAQDNSVQQRSSEYEYVKIRSKDGSEQTVVKMQKMPEIRGVLVVCSGAGSAVTREKVTAAVSGALGVERSKVTVVY